MAETSQPAKVSAWWYALPVVLFLAGLVLGVYLAVAGFLGVFPKPLARLDRSPHGWGQTLTTLDVTKPGVYMICQEYDSHDEEDGCATPRPVLQVDIRDYRGTTLPLRPDTSYAYDIGSRCGRSIYSAQFNRSGIYSICVQSADGAQAVRRPTALILTQACQWGSFGMVFWGIGVGIAGTILAIVAFVIILVKRSKSKNQPLPPQPPPIVVPPQ
jgi:hypothetical protein